MPQTNDNDDDSTVHISSFSYELQNYKNKTFHINFIRKYGDTVELSE